MRLTGHVKWYNDSRGYGCIRPEKGEDLLVRSSAIKGEGLRILEPGQRVEFDLAPGPNGPQVERVIRIDDGGSQGS